MLTKTKITLFFTSAAALASLSGAPLNNAGNITATNESFVKATTDIIADRHVIADNGSVKAQTYFTTPGYLQVGTSGYFGTTLSAGGTITSSAGVTGTTYISTNGYVSSAGAGYFVNFLRIGANTNTPAAKSVQIGQYATNDSFNALVVGRYNLNKAKDGTTNPTPASWVDNDPLFVVGNGTGVAGADQYRDALTVYKDGTVTMSKAQGDILMGQFGN